MIYLRSSRAGITLIECCIYLMSIMVISGLLLTVLSAFYTRMQSQLAGSHAFTQGLVAWRVLEYDIATAHKLTIKMDKNKQSELFIKDHKNSYKWHIKNGSLIRGVWSDKKPGYISNSIAGGCKKFSVFMRKGLVNFSLTLANGSHTKNILGSVHPRLVVVS